VKKVGREKSFIQPERSVKKILIQAQENPNANEEEREQVSELCSPLSRAMFLIAGVSS
jgi:hypothetical protein